MIETMHGAAALANLTTDTSVGVSRQKSRLIATVKRVAHDLWHGTDKKIPIELAIRTGSHPRTCERWLALRTGMSADALAALLQSEEGLHFLDALMCAASPVPEWWLDFRAAIEREQINRQLDELRQRLKARDLTRAKPKPRG